MPGIENRGRQRDPLQDEENWGDRCLSSELEDAIRESNLRREGGDILRGSSFLYSGRNEPPDFSGGSTSPDHSTCVSDTESHPPKDPEPPRPSFLKGVLKNLFGH